MDIPASKILPIENLGEYKIHFAVWNGEEQPLDVFVRDPDEWKGWNRWQASANKKKSAKPYISKGKKKTDVENDPTSKS